MERMHKITGNKLLIKISVGILALVALVGAFWSGHYVGAKGAFDSTANMPSADSTAVTDAQFAPFWQVWHILDGKYVAAASTTVQQKIYGAIQGLAASEGDPYTVFFPPQQDQAFQSEIQGDFEGVGMEIDVKDGNLTVIAPLKGSPAEAAGIHAGDIITKIESTSTQNMTVDDGVSLIRGPKGTVVDLTIMRAGEAQPLNIKITRNVINIPTVETSQIGTGASSVFTIQLLTFTASSPDLFRTALRSFVESGSHKLVLDLRGDPGGYLEAAWDIASWFLPAGDIVVTEDYGGKQPSQVYRSKGYNIFNSNLDMMILVDGGTASAAEILAGALEQHGVATLVGTKTFGKGSVQELIPITSDTSLKVTVARWLTPDGTNLSHNGLDPEVIVPITNADIASGTDPQMLKAVSLLNAKP
jgi:carboxyl-terminal processing protease